MSGPPPPPIPNAPGPPSGKSKPTTGRSGLFAGIRRGFALKKTSGAKKTFQSEARSPSYSKPLTDAIGIGTINSYVQECKDYLDLQQSYLVYGRAVIDNKPYKLDKEAIKKAVLEKFIKYLDKHFHKGSRLEDRLKLLEKRGEIDKYVTEFKKDMQFTCEYSNKKITSDSMKHLMQYSNECHDKCSDTHKDFPLRPIQCALNETTHNNLLTGITRKVDINKSTCPRTPYTITQRYEREYMYQLMEHIIESKWVPMQVSLNGLLLDILRYEGSDPDKLKLTVSAIGTNMTNPNITRAFSNKYCDVFRKRYMKNFATKSVIIKGQSREFPSFISTDSAASRCYGNPRDLYILCRVMWDNIYRYFTNARWSKPKNFNCSTKYGKYTRAILSIIDEYIVDKKNKIQGRSIGGFLENCNGVLENDPSIVSNFVEKAKTAKIFEIKDQSTRNRKAMNMFSIVVTKAPYTDGPFDPSVVWFKYMGLEDPKNLYNWIRDFGSKIFTVVPYNQRSVFSRGYHTVSKDYINKIKDVGWIESKLGIAGISDLHATLRKTLPNAGYFRASSKIKYLLDPEDTVDPYARFNALKALAEYVIKANGSATNPIKTAIAASDVKKAVGGKVTLTEAEYNKLRKSCPDRSGWISPSEYKKKVRELSSSGAVDTSNWMSIKKHKDLMSKCASKTIDMSKWISLEDHKSQSTIDMSKWISRQEHKNLMSKCASKTIDMSKWISRQEHNDLMSKQKSLQDQTRDWIFTKKKALRLNSSRGNYSEPTEVYMPSVLVNGICRPIVVGPRGSVYIQRNGWKQYTTPDVFNKKWCKKVYMK